MSELKAMLSRVIREGGNFVSRDKAAEALREYTDKEKSFQSRISELEEFKKEALEVIGFYGEADSWQSVQVGYGDKSQIKWHDIEDVSYDDRVRELGGKRSREFMAKWDEKIEGEK